MWTIDTIIETSQRCHLNRGPARSGFKTTGGPTWSPSTMKCEQETPKQEALPVREEELREYIEELFHEEFFGKVLGG